MIGAIAGDVIGSIYELDQIKTKTFSLFDSQCQFTDDTVMTVAVADVMLEGESYSERFRHYYRRYQNAGYGGRFHRWARSREPKPYGSFGNGAAMRVSPIAFAFDSLEIVLAEAKRSSEVTHDHPEGIKGAAAVFLARFEMEKDEIRYYIEREFGYDLSPSLDEIRPDYKFDVTCQGTVPAALISFLESTGFEDAVRNAISLGGDSDTLACIAGGIAGAYYGVPPQVERETRNRLDDELRAVVDRFTKQFMVRRKA